MMEPYIELIYKELDGRIAREEATRLADWRKQSPENESAYQAILEAWAVSADVPALEQEVDLDIAFGEVMGKIKSSEDVETKTGKKESAKIFSFSRIVSIAASVALLIGAFWFFTQKENVADDMHRFAVTEAKQEFVLPDQSKLVAKKGAVIAYPKNFGQKNRNIEFEGEGYFAVTPNAELPFKVQTPHFENTVLGTTFVINDTKESTEADVVLLEGKLAVKTIDGVKTLESGDQLKYKPEEKMVIVFEDDKADIDPVFIKNVLDFDGRSLSKVGEILSSVYGKKIEMSAEMTDCKFTGKLSAPTLRSALESLSDIYGADLVVETEGFLLKGGTCK